MGRPRLGRRGRIGLAAVLVVLLATAGVGAWLVLRPSDATAAQTITTTVARGTYQDTVSATGTLNARREADLDFGVSGTVTHVRVAAGDTVTKGQVLATLDTTSLETAVVSAQASLDAARQQYSDDSDNDVAAATLSADSASVAAAESSLTSAQEDLDHATLRATMGGTVASVGIEVGDSVGGSSSSQSAGGTSGGTGAATTPGSTTSTTSGSSSSTESAVVLVSPHEFKVTADVSADDIKSVKKGMQATITPSGSTTKVFGTVTGISLVAETSSTGAAQFPVTVTVTGRKSGLYVGTSATVAIVTKQVSNVLTVPALALHSSGSSTYVYTLTNGQRTKTPVTVGDTYGNATVVSSGLKSGDKVVITTFRPPTGGTTNRSGNQNGLPGGGGFGGNGPPAGGLPGGGFGGGQP